MAAYGGAYMAMVLGFLGLDFKTMKLKPNLPKEIEDIKFNLLDFWGGNYD
jgi:trehalose/maltose hydrolase-like predicted phosphorylase